MKTFIVKIKLALTSKSSKLCHFNENEQIIANLKTVRKLNYQIIDSGGNDDSLIFAIMKMPILDLKTQEGHALFSMCVFCVFVSLRCSHPILPFYGEVEVLIFSPIWFPSRDRK